MTQWYSEITTLNIIFENNLNKKSKKTYKEIEELKKGINENKL